MVVLGGGEAVSELPLYQRPARVLAFFRKRTIKSIMLTDVSSAGLSCKKMLSRWADSGYTEFR